MDCRAYAWRARRECPLFGPCMLDRYLELIWDPILRTSPGGVEILEPVLPRGSFCARDYRGGLSRLCRRSGIAPTSINKTLISALRCFAARLLLIDCSLLMMQWRVCS